MSFLRPRPKPSNGFVCVAFTSSGSVLLDPYPGVRNPAQGFMVGVGCRRRRTVGEDRGATGLTGICGIDPYEYKRPSPAQRPARSAGGGGDRARLGRRYFASAPFSPFASLGSLNEEDGNACSRPRPRCWLRRSRLSAHVPEDCRKQKWAVVSPFTASLDNRAPALAVMTTYVGSPSSPHEMTYWVSITQTGGKILADRRLSRLLK